MDKGKLLILSGPSGVGKGTVLEKLMENFKAINYSVSATTRLPRPGETHGKDYYFISKEEFFKMQENDEFIESAKVHNNYYGTLKKNVEQCLNNGEDIILEIDIQGAKQVREHYPEAVFIFLVPPSFEELENRLNKRGSEDIDNKRLRLKNAKNEMRELEKYDYKIVNDQLDKTVENLKEIILAEKQKERNDLR